MCNLLHGLPEMRGRLGIPDHRNDAEHTSDTICLTKVYRTQRGVDRAAVPRAAAVTREGNLSAGAGKQEATRRLSSRRAPGAASRNSRGDTRRCAGAARIATPDQSAHERQEVLDRELRLLQDVGEGRALDRSVRRHDDLERFLLGVLLKTDVTSVLANHDPAVALKGPDDAIVGKLWNFVQTAISTSSAASVISRAARSSSTGSRYN